MFDTGYISEAPLFMDIVTTYFTFLPLFIIVSIFFAKSKKYKLHIFSQILIYTISMFVVLFFEVAIRVYGGFSIFLENSTTNKNFFLIALSLHILVALISLVSWSIFIIKTFLVYKKEGMNASIFKNHKLKAILVFTGVTITSYSGTWMYYLLFIN